MAQRVFDVKRYGASGTGTVDDAAAIQAAITAATAAGGGVVFLPAGTYLVSVPIALANGIVFVGASKFAVLIQKTAESTNGDGIDAVIYGNGVSNFCIVNVTVKGNRTTTVNSTEGIYLNACSFFNINSTRVQDCNYGYTLKGCWCSGIDHAVALRCALYAFYAFNTCTSLCFKNCTGWGTGGCFKLSGVIYSTIINPSYDYGDYGKHASDPFAGTGGGSGGDYQNPGYYFHASASNVTIMSPGCENGFSKFLYSEGGKLVFLNPYAYNIECHATTWRFIELRGTGVSEVELVNPDFRGITNELTEASTRCGVFIETPKSQRLTLNNIKGIEAEITGFGAYQFSSRGIHITETVNYLGDRTPAAITNGDTVITVFDLGAGILTMASADSGKAPTVPTGTLVNTTVAVGDSIDWSFINTGDQTVTITQAADHTLVGGMALAAGTQGLFRTRCTAANTAITYRLA